jgi:hypothetical protein
VGWRFRLSRVNLGREGDPRERSLFPHGSTAPPSLLY